MEEADSYFIDRSCQRISEGREKEDPDIRFSDETRLMGKSQQRVVVNDDLTK